MREYSAHQKTSDLPKRTDAEANRRTLIHTARRVFAQKGAEISMAEIAKAAKVSRPTLYRNFKDKGALVVAVFEYNIDLLDRYAQKLKQDQQACFKILEMIAYQQARFQALIVFFPGDETPLIQRVLDIMASPIERAKAQNLLRADFHLESDLLLIIRMLALSIGTNNGDQWKKEAQRALQLLLEGLRTDT